MGDEPAAAPCGHLSVPSPSPFLMHRGDPPLPYRAWFTSFATYLTLVEYERGTLEDRYKNALLYQHLGTEGIHQFANQPAAQRIHPDTFTAFSDAVAIFFAHPVRIRRAHLTFQERMQGLTEMVSEFVTALRELATDCRYTDLGLQEMLAQQMLAGCWSKEVKR